MNDGYRNLPEYLQNGSVLAATVLTGENAGQKLFWRQDGRILSGTSHLEAFWSQVIPAVGQAGISGICSVCDTVLYAERLMQEPELVICGGGHISLELAALADYLEYPYMVLDDREEFCNRERFPGAAACLCGSFSETLSGLSCAGNAYYIIVTRGHRADLECLKLSLNRPHGYVGMIGSRAKVAKSMQALAEEGYPKEVLEAIHAPIGLDIGGETPKEIAVSIVAQLIQEKNRENSAGYVDKAMMAGLTAMENKILVTIIGKRGSAPRGTGSRMIVGENGICCGTIGGGLVEYEAEKQARQMLSQACERIYRATYQVNESSAAALGMWCGGEVDVLFEQL